MITLNQPNQTTQLQPKPDQDLHLYLGASTNHLIITFLSPWKHAPRKLLHLTQKLYLYDPKHYQPHQPNSRARRLITEYEHLRLGSIRYPLFFGIHKASRFLEPEHLDLLFRQDTLTLTHLAKKNWTKIKPTPTPPNPA